MNENDNINNYIPSLLNPRTIRNENISFTQYSIISTSSLSLKKKFTNNIKIKENKVYRHKKENVNVDNITATKDKNIFISDKSNGNHSLGTSAIEDLIFKDNINETSPINIDEYKSYKEVYDNICNGNKNSSLKYKSFVNNSSVTYSKTADKHDSYKVKSPVSLSFGISNCKNIYVYSEKSTLKGVSFQVNENDINVDCELSEGSQLSQITIGNMSNMSEPLFSPLKRKSVAVNLEIKKMKLAATDKNTESKVLFLNTNANEKLVYVIEQPLNYKLLKRTIIDKNKSIDSIRKTKTVFRHEINGKSIKLKQLSLDSYFQCNNRLKTPLKSKLGDSQVWHNEYKVKLDNNDKQDMSKNSVQSDAIRRTPNKLNRNDSKSPQSHKTLPKLDIQPMFSEDKRASSSRSKKGSTGSHSPRKNMDSIQLNQLLDTKSNRASIVARNVPHFKIVAGTHFAVDAFSYGEIPNVKHYFLTHFHSDHYLGLRKTFNKVLYCSKITANLCKSRLGVNPKCINIIDVDETIKIDGVEITAVDANHCPGAIMLVFTLPNGKTLLHTGDFRATPAMESYPVFWNKDIHTIYLDTTYCNPRYDFPTQEQCIDMAIHLLRLKKTAVEDAGRQFSSVLIVCGTYTIGKEKFYEGVSRRVGCAVWACPEKARVLSAARAAPAAAAPAAAAACQLHVVPMRDLTHDTLRSYLNSLNGVFTEVVAFKPSGWENGKNSFIEKDCVTIHGIPYSEHSSFSELVRFVKFLRPKQVVPTVHISGGIESVQEYFRPFKLVNKDEIQCKNKVTDYFTVQTRQPVT
ncbi:unnamed protein product, partial [Brenthis ino]